MLRLSPSRIDNLAHKVQGWQLYRELFQIRLDRGKWVARYFGNATIIARAANKGDLLNQLDELAEPVLA